MQCSQSEVEPDKEQSKEWLVNMDPDLELQLSKNGNKGINPLPNNKILD